ncbi:MAG: hypothetical protein EXS35_18695 [Pedosphaera sp.]|nr:hypothetical protein [Pedosphaera sp.]
MPLVEKQKEFPLIPLPGIPITIAGVPCVISPAFVLAVGAEANAPGGLSIPLEMSATLGTEIGWANGQTFSRPINDFAAPHVSDPTVFDGVAITAKAWAEARLEVNISVAGGLAKAGPSLAIRAEAAFGVAPFSDPWWNVDLSADLIAAFEMNLLGFNVARVETNAHIATFFHRDAGGSLIPPPPPGPGTPVDIGPKAGKNVRWGLAFAAPNSGAEYSKGFVTPLKDGGYFVGGSSANPSFLGVVSSQGNVQWMQTFPTGGKPVDGLQLADGSMIVAGSQGLDWWLAHYDTNGVRQWVRSYEAWADLRKLAVGFAGNGDPEFYLAGYQNPVVITQSDPVVWKLDKDGNLIWSKVYALSGDDEVYSIRMLRDGNLLLLGDTDADVGTSLFIGADNNGLIAKITPAGDLLWAKAVPGRIGMIFSDAAEAPDGTLYAVGSHGDIVTDFYPSILVAKFSPDGELLAHVLIGEDADWSDELPNGGDTPYDYAAQAAWTSNGLVVVGTTGLGGNATAWAASLTDELGVRWFSAFDGPGATAFDDVAITEDGIVAMGWAEKVWPTKFVNRTPAWLLSLPWEGLMRFHPNTGIQSHYLQPHVFLSSNHKDFIGTITDAQQRVQQVRTADVPFVTSNSVPAVGANITAGVASTFVTARLERLELSVVDSYEEWAAYNQMTGTNSTGTGDTDGDGIKNGTEFFFGTNPLIKDTNPPPSLVLGYDTANGTVSIDFNRAQAAINQPFALHYSTNLTTWMPASAVNFDHISNFNFLDKIRLTLPAPATGGASFRMEIPITP